MRWLDKPVLWDENISSPLSATDFNKFQSQLDDIVGREPDGTHRWRLVWGQNLDAAPEWDRYANAWIPRYRWAWKMSAPRANPATGILERHKEWIGVPRYFIEALIPRARRNEA